MAQVSASSAGIKLFGATIEVQGRQVNKEETNKGGGGGGDPTVEKRPDKIIPCPRCKSMETKFCYFNNYNVNQPRHFCKGCQRYWTAGGALRNVPVGAGRRKSKPPCRGLLSDSDACLFDDASNGVGGRVHQFEFDGVVEEWHAHVAEHAADFQHIFPAKRRRNYPSSDSQLC